MTAVYIIKKVTKLVNQLHAVLLHIDSSTIVPLTECRKMNVILLFSSIAYAHMNIQYNKLKIIPIQKLSRRKLIFFWIVFNYSVIILQYAINDNNNNVYNCNKSSFK